MTGVTVTLLAVGLFVAGFGTAIFLRNTLIASVDEQVEQLAPTDIASSLFDIGVDRRRPRVHEKETCRSTTHFVAIYGPDGTLRASAGGGGAPDRSFPRDHPSNP